MPLPATKPQQLRPQPEHKPGPVALRLPLGAAPSSRPSLLKPHSVDIRAEGGRRLERNAVVLAAHEAHLLLAARRVGVAPVDGAADLGSGRRGVGSFKVLSRRVADGRALGPRSALSTKDSLDAAGGGCGGRNNIAKAVPSVLAVDGRTGWGSLLDATRFLGIPTLPLLDHLAVVLFLLDVLALLKLAASGSDLFGAVSRV